MVSSRNALVLWLASIAAAQGDPKNVEPDSFYPREPDSPILTPVPMLRGLVDGILLLRKQTLHLPADH